MALLLAACAGAPPTEAPLPYGEVVSPRDLFVLPDHSWSYSAKPTAWSFRGSAALLVWVRGAAPEELRLTLRPVGETRKHRFRVEWDGEELGEAALAGEAFEIDLTGVPLGTGRHELRLVQIHRRPDQSPNNDFTALSLGRGGAREEVALAAFERLRHLAEFLEVGGTGAGQTKRGGLLFDGPGRWQGGLDLAAPAALQLRAENLSGEAATFSLGLGADRHRLAVEPGAERLFRVPLEAGSRPLRLSVEGAADGVFLWGEPYLESLQEEADAGPPPVFLITLDTTRRDVLSPYSGRADLTPHLEAFARRATVYEQAFATAPWTLPSHGSMMTGLYPSRHGAGVTEAHLPATVPTLAGLARERGYFTAGFAGGKLCSHEFGLGHGFLSYRDPDSFETVGDRLTDALVAFLDENHRKRLFVFANYFDPHALYQAPPEFAERVELASFRPALDGKPLWQAFDEGVNPSWRRIIDGEAAPVTDGIRAYLRAAYEAEVAFMDAQLGRLFEALRRHGLFERSLIVLVADHGELLGEHGGLVSHAGRLDPELMEIPLLVKWPHQEEGLRIAAPVSQVDLFPTVLAALGIEAPPSDGRPLPREDEGSAARRLLLEEHESRVHPLPERLRIASHVYGVQQLEERQIVWEGGGECARRQDGAWQPLACEQDPRILLAGLERRLGALGKVEHAGVMTKEQEEGLRALGYLK